ncbi:MAG TPA: sensor histidine kinase KdpD [Steroidobacteraceae bacterium]|jgi:two-component system sensor histidine kinase KdpD|nr:sensor histidine kinase KdpD [Steroidobacteraceae bacterium]
MSASRPDPDLLLTRVRESELRARRGRLTIFFGANAGVGKTYAMLEAAQQRLREGLEVVAGYVELHGRAETERLLAGLEQLRVMTIRMGNTTRREFDLDAALARKPSLLLLDELAHTNVGGGDPPPRHAKRWQDVEELLDAGIDVYTTVNVQHLESLSDLVWQITGARQQETLPDRIFDEADEIKLVDVPPDDLLQRLREGRIYQPAQAEQALANFFRKGNLIALRELALRRTADRVDQAMRAYRQEKSVRVAWATRERLLVAVGPDGQAEALVRAGKRIADRLDAEWLVVYVETPDLLRLSEAERDRRIAVLRLATTLGAEAITLGGASASTELLAYARTRNASRIVVGSPNRRRRWRYPHRRSTTERLLEAGAEFDIMVVARRGIDAGADAGAGNATYAARDSVYASTSDKARWPRYLMALGATAVTTLLCSQIYRLWPGLNQSNLVMLYLLNSALIAVYAGRRAASLSALLGVAAFDFLFVPPRFSFAVSDAQYAITFIVMLAVALIIGNLNASVRLQARVAGHRERRTALLYAMTRQLAMARSREEMAEIAVRHVGPVFASRAVILFPDEQGKLAHPRSPIADVSFTGADLGVGQWVIDHAKPAGMGTDTLSGSAGLYLPLSGSERVFGVIALLAANPRRITLPEQYRLLETFAAQIGQALERADIASHAQAAVVRAETEAIRNALLASISHDLRTPLATIAAGAATLAGNMDALGEQDRRLLANSVSDEAARMSDRVTTLLELVRLETGAIALRLDEYALDELVGTVLHRLDQRLHRRDVRIELPDALPLLTIDGRLIEQVLENLLDNVSKYTPADSVIWIRAQTRRRHVEVSIEDDGPGLPGADPEILFEKFQRGAPEGSVGGIGLGLAICRTIVRLHHGRIWAENRAPGGAAFRFTLPLPPSLTEGGNV